MIDSSFLCPGMCSVTHGTLSLRPLETFGELNLSQVKVRNGDPQCQAASGWGGDGVAQHLLQPKIVAGLHLKAQRSKKESEVLRTLPPYTL